MFTKHIFHIHFNHPKTNLGKHHALSPFIHVKEHLNLEVLGNSLTIITPLHVNNHIVYPIYKTITKTNLAHLKIVSKIFTTYKFYFFLSMPNIIHTHIN